MKLWITRMTVCISLSTLFLACGDPSVDGGANATDTSQTTVGDSGTNGSSTNDSSTNDSSTNDSSTNDSSTNDTSSGDTSGGSTSGDTSGGSTSGSTSGGSQHGSSPTPNAYSWDGSWNPSVFPLAGMVDETHAALPPGKWGWDNGCDCPGDAGLAIFENEYLNKGLDIARIEDSAGQLFGWRLLDTDGGGITLDHRGDHYEGTPGVDIFDLGAGGSLQGTGPSDRSTGINLGDGPDMLRYGVGWSVDMRVGDQNRGGAQDNDLVILGTNGAPALNAYDVYGTTIHTGPGADLVFVRNFGPASIDLGNGASGRTDTLDPGDGDDMIILQGNTRDFRVYGGAGSDVAVWYVEEVNDDRWLGPNFFGGGGWGDALWGDPGVDRLVLVVDAGTEVVSARGQHDDNPGSLLAMVYSPYEVSVDAPTESDPYARYYATVPVGPGGEHTITLSFRSPDGAVFTHDFYITAIEELQLGITPGSPVYDVNQVTGALTLSEAAPLIELPSRAAHEALFESFGR